MSGSRDFSFLENLFSTTRCIGRIKSYDDQKTEDVRVTAFSISCDNPALKDYVGRAEDGRLKSDKERVDVIITEARTSFFSGKMIERTLYHGRNLPPACGEMASALRKDYN